MKGLENIRISRIRVAVMLFGIVILGIIFFKGQQEYPIAIAGESASETALAGSSSELQQYWQASAAAITGITVPYDVQKTQLSKGTIVTACVMMDEDAEQILAQTQLTVHPEKGTLNGTLPKAKLQIGKRYVIRLQLENGQHGDVLTCYLNPELSGLSVNGAAQDGALDITLHAACKSQMFWLLDLLCTVTILSFAAGTLWDKKFEETIGLTFIAIGLWILLFGYLGDMSLGILTVHLLSLLAFVFICFTAENGRDYFTPGCLFFLILTGFLALYDRSNVRTGWDEYDHWGLVVKDMFVSDQLPMHAGSVVFVPNYPPMMALVQYWFEKTRGIFSEGILYFAYHMFAYSVLMILFTGIKWRDWKKLIPLALIVFLIPAAVFDAYFHSIDIDAFLGVIAAYPLICYFLGVNNKKLEGFDLFRMTMGLCAIVMTKETGVVLVAISYGIVLGDALRRSGRKLLHDVAFCQYTGGTFCAAYVFLLWEVYLNRSINFIRIILTITLLLGASGILIWKKQKDRLQSVLTAFAANRHRKAWTALILVILGIILVQCTKLLPYTAKSISLQGIMNLLIGQGQAYQYTSIKVFLKYIFEGQVFLKTAYLYAWMILLMIIGIFDYLAGREQYRTEIFRRVALPLFIGSIAYYLFLMISYLFVFTQEEAVQHEGAKRYLRSYLLMVLIILVMMIIHYSREWDASGLHNVIWYIMAAIIIITPVTDMFWQPSEAEEEMAGIHYGYDHTAQTFQTFSDSSEAVYYLSDSGEKDAGTGYFVFRNAVVPQIVSDYGSFCADYNEQTLHHLLQQGNYQYLYVGSDTQKIHDTYANLPVDKPIKQGNIYRILIAPDGTLSLKKIAYALN